MTVDVYTCSLSKYTVNISVYPRIFCGVFLILTEPFRIRNVCVRKSKVYGTGFVKVYIQKTRHRISVHDVRIFSTVYTGVG